MIHNSWTHRPPQSIEEAYTRALAEIYLRPSTPWTWRVWTIVIVLGVALGYILRHT